MPIYFHRPSLTSLCIFQLLNVQFLTIFVNSILKSFKNFFYHGKWYCFNFRIHLSGACIEKYKKNTVSIFIIVVLNSWLMILTSLSYPGLVRMLALSHETLFYAFSMPS